MLSEEEAREAASQAASQAASRAMGDHIIYDLLEYSDEESDECPDLEEPFPAVSAILPPRLEELHFKILPTLSDNIEDMCAPPFYSFTDFEDEDLSNWLCDIARNKDSRYPDLKTVVGWQFNYSSLLPRVEEIEELDPDDTLDVQTAFKEADIDIYWVTSAEPLMFRG